MKIYLRLRRILQNIVLIKGYLTRRFLKDLKCLYIEQQSFDINEAKTDKTEGINGKIIITIGNVNTCFSIINTTTREKFSKE